MKMRSLAKDLLCAIAPRSFWRQLCFEYSMSVVRLGHSNRKRKYRNATDLCINFGAGPNGRSGWVNVDGAPNIGVNCLCDCRYQLPFPSGSARCIFSEHFFEHLDFYEEAPLFLRECFRLLKPSGVLRIIVPDAGRYLEAYNGQGWSALKELRGIHDGFHDSYYPVRFTSKIELVNLIFRQFSEHKFGYDYDCLKSILLAAGYVKVAKVGFGISCDPTVAIDQLSRQHESLYVEAIKP